MDLTQGDQLELIDAAERARKQHLPIHIEAGILTGSGCGWCHNHGVISEVGPLFWSLFAVAKNLGLREPLAHTSAHTFSTDGHASAHLLVTEMALVKTMALDQVQALPPRGPAGFGSAPAGQQLAGAFRCSQRSDSLRCQFRSSEARKRSLPQGLMRT